MAEKHSKVHKGTNSDSANRQNWTNVRIFIIYLIVSKQLFKKEHPTTSKENNLHTIQKIAQIDKTC